MSCTDAIDGVLVSGMAMLTWISMGTVFPLSFLVSVMLGMIEDPFSVASGSRTLSEGNDRSVPSYFLLSRASESL